MRPSCMNQFSYPWFPSVQSEDQGNWLGGTFNEPPNAKTVKYFRLPALDITKLTCTKSPLVDGGGPRSPKAGWSSVVPSQCGDDLTKRIVDIVGPGYHYIDPARNTNATLVMADDNDTVTCQYTLDPTQSYFTVLDVNVVGR